MWDNLGQLRVWSPWTWDVDSKLHNFYADKKTVLSMLQKQNTMLHACQNHMLELVRSTNLSGFIMIHSSMR